MKQFRLREVLSVTSRICLCDPNPPLSDPVDYPMAPVYDVMDYVMNTKHTTIGLVQNANAVTVEIFRQRPELVPLSNLARDMAKRRQAMAFGDKDAQYVADCLKLDELHPFLVNLEPCPPDDRSLPDSDSKYIAENYPHVRVINLGEDDDVHSGQN